MGKLVKSGSKYSDDDRRQAVILYHIHGTHQKVADFMNIPRQTVTNWSDQEWWGELSQEISLQTESQILAKNQKIIDAGQDELQDRIENGDYRPVKVKKAIKHEDGSMEMSEGYENIRVPMTGRDLTIASGTMQDKRRIQLNLPTSIISSQASNDALQKTLDKCAAIGQSLKEKSINSIAGKCTEITDEVADHPSTLDTKKGKLKK